MVSSATLIMLNRRRGRWQTLKLEIRSARTVELEEFGAISRLEVALDGETRILPELCANQTDYERGAEQGIAAKATMFNYHHVIKKARITDREVERIKATFRKVERKYEPQVTSMSFALRKKDRLTHNERIGLLGLQKELGTTVITDTESDRNQDLGRFRKELEEFDRFDTDQIKSPTISLRCDAREAFRQKVGAVATDDRYMRVNVQWGGYRKYRANWTALLEAIDNRAKWCNMTDVFPRRTGRNQYPIRSNISYGLAHGVHTFCYGTGNFRGGDTTSLVLNGENWCYEETENDYQADMARSFNVVSDEFKTLGKIIGTPALHEYLKPRVGLRIEKSI